MKRPEKNDIIIYLSIKIAVIFFCIGLFQIHNSLVIAEAKNKNVTDSQQVITLDFDILEKAEEYITKNMSDLTEIPQDILAMDGKIVAVTGYLYTSKDNYFFERSIVSFAVGKNAYGCPCCVWGPRPTIFNTVFVDMKEGENISPPFTPLIEVTGIFLVKKEQFVDENGNKKLSKIYHMTNAQAKKKEKPLIRSILGF